MKVLVVDDDPEFASAVVSTLRHEGHEVDAAPDGEMALRVARSSAPEAVVLDLLLPDLHGLTVARRLRHDVLPADVSIIVITGTRVPIESADAAGVDFVIEKPVEPEHLGGLIEFVTRRRQAACRNDTAHR